MFPTAHEWDLGLSEAPHSILVMHPAVRIALSYKTGRHRKYR